MIELSGLGKTFHTANGSVEALRDINLTIADGEFVTIVGRSGCGKSTLLRLIAGLTPPSAGTVTVDGDPVHRPRRDVGLMFQRPALLPWRNVIDNVLLPIEVIHRKTAPYRERAMELLAMTGLAGFEHRMPNELSGGMQQRVSLCRSLVHDPPVLLMDEPFAALDALTREELTLELQSISAKQAKTVVFITHSMDEAVLLGDRAVVLSARPGRMKQIVDVPVERPRTLGHGPGAAKLAECRATLHDLLFDRSEELVS